MRKLLPLLFVTALGFCCACSKQPEPAKTSEANSPSSGSAELVAEYVRVLKEEAPEVTVTVKGNLELEVKAADGYSLRVFLDNAFTAWKQDPASRPEIIQKHVRS